jgi:transposase
MLGLEHNTRLWHPPCVTLNELKLLSRERSALPKDKNVDTNRQGAKFSSSYNNAKADKRFKARKKLLDIQIVAIEEDMRELVFKDTVLQQKLMFLESIPDVLCITAAAVVGETLGCESINNAKQLKSFAGYDVVFRDSGNFSGKTRISKKGNSHIRAVLHMFSMTCVLCNPALKQFYERLKPKKVKPLIALISVQRKLLMLMYMVWKNEEMYNQEYEKKKQQKLKTSAALDNKLITQLIT